MAIIETGSNTSWMQNVDANFNSRTNLPWYNSVWVEEGGGYKNAPAMFGEIDTGASTGIRDMKSPEIDDDFRIRNSGDNLIDGEGFNYTAQNTGKHSFTFTNLNATIGTGWITTNSGSITTTTTGLTFGTFGMFPMGGAQTTICETSVAFSAQPTANTIIDFGLFQRGATTAFAPLDGVYFRLSAAGIQGIINSAGTEVFSSVFPFTYTNNATNRYLIQVSNVRTTFWVNNEKTGEIPTPVSLNFPCKSQSLPWSFRHAIVGGAAGAVLQAVFSDYRIVSRGAVFSDSLAQVTSRVLGTMQGFSGGTMGTIGTYTNNTNPIAAVPTNTTLAVGAAGLLNQAWETFSLALTTDGILLSYQLPAGSATVQGRRFKISGVSLSSFVQTVLIWWPQNRTFALAFGWTTVSQITSESASMASATAKARRIVLLPMFTQSIVAAQAVSTTVSQPETMMTFPKDADLYVNPGEFIQVIVKGVGTVGTSGTLATNIQIFGSWE